MFDSNSAQAEGLQGVGQALFNQFGACCGDAAQIGRRRRRHRDKGERNHRETDACDCSGNQHVVHVERIEAQHIDGDMFEGLDVHENGQGEYREKDGEAGQHKQGDVEAAMKLLLGTALTALSEMALVVATHFRRNTGDVVPPACQDGAYNPIIATISCHSLLTHFAGGSVQNFLIKRAVGGKSST